MHAVETNKAGRKWGQGPYREGGHLSLSSPRKRTQTKELSDGGLLGRCREHNCEDGDGRGEGKWTIKGVLLGQLPQEANEAQSCWETQEIAETESFSSQWLKESG